MLLDPDFQELLACINGLPNVTQGPAPVLWQNSSGQLGNADTSSHPSSSTSVDREDSNMLFDTVPSFSSGLASGVDNTASTGLHQVQHNGTDMNHRMPSLTTSPPSPSPLLSYAHTYNSVDTDSSDLNAPFQLPNQSVFSSTFGSTPMPPLSVLPPASATSFLGMRSPIQQRGMDHQAHQTSTGWHTEASGPQASSSFQGQLYHDTQQAFSHSNQAFPTSLPASNTPVSAEPPYQRASSYQNEILSPVEQFPYEIPASWTQPKTGYTNEYDAYHEEALTPQHYDSRPTIATIAAPSSSQTDPAYSQHKNFDLYHTQVPASQHPSVHSPRQAHGQAIAHGVRENADCSAFFQGGLELPQKLTFDQPSEADEYVSSKDLLVKLYEILGQLLGRSTPAKGGDKLIQPSQSNRMEVGRRDTFVSPRASQQGAEASTARLKRIANHRGAQPSSKTSPRHHPYHPTQQRAGSDPASATSRHASNQPKSTPSSSASQDAGRPRNSKKRNEKKGPQESEAPRTQMLVRPEDHNAMVPKPIEIDDIWTKYEFGPAEKKDPLTFRPYHGPVAKGKRSEK